MKNNRKIPFTSSIATRLLLVVLVLYLLVSTAVYG